MHITNAFKITEMRHFDTQSARWAKKVTAPFYSNSFNDTKYLRVVF